MFRRPRTLREAPRVRGRRRRRAGSRLGSRRAAPRSSRRRRSPWSPDWFMWSRSSWNWTLTCRPRAFNECSVSARNRSGGSCEPDEGGLLELEPTDHLECAGIGTHRAGPVLRRRSPLPAPIEDLPRTRRRKSLRGAEAVEVPGIHIDLGQLDAGELINPVDPVVVQESTTDNVPLVDDRAVDLEDRQQPSVGWADRTWALCRASSSIQFRRPGSVRRYRGALNERCHRARPHVNGRRHERSTGGAGGSGRAGLDKELLHRP